MKQTIEQAMKSIDTQANELENAIKEILIEGESVLKFHTLTGIEVTVRGPGYGARMNVDLLALSATKDISSWFEKELKKYRKE